MYVTRAAGSGTHEPAQLPEHDEAEKPFPTHDSFRNDGGAGCEQYDPFASSRHDGAAVSKVYSTTTWPVRVRTNVPLKFSLPTRLGVTRLKMVISGGDSLDGALTTVKNAPVRPVASQSP